MNDDSPEPALIRLEGVSRTFGGGDARSLGSGRDSTADDSCCRARSAAHSLGSHDRRSRSSADCSGPRGWTG